MDVPSIDQARSLCLDTDSCSSAHSVVESEEYVEEWWRRNVAEVQAACMKDTDSLNLRLYFESCGNEDVPASASSSKLNLGLPCLNFPDELNVFLRIFEDLHLDSASRFHP